jgi:dTDP-4-amino-4,6-dideoxygalactose transaminase
VVGDLSVANIVMERSLFIGVYPGLEPAQLEYVVEAFYDFVKSQNLEVVT